MTNYSYQTHYYCNKTLQTAPFLLYIAAPAFLVPPLPPSGRSFYEVQSGSTVILPCTGYSVPPPNVRWFLEGNHLDTGNGYEIEPTTSSLIISNFTKRASTNFSCSLQNVEGTIKSEDVILRRLSIPSGIVTLYITSILFYLLPLFPNSPSLFR